MKEFIINNKYKVKAKDLKEAKKKYLDWKESQVKIEDIEYLGVVVEDAYPDVVTEFQRKTGMTLTNFNKYPHDDWRADFKHPKPVGGGYLIALLEPISDKKVAMEIWFSNNRSSYKQVNGTVSKCASEAKYMYEDEVSTVKLLNMAGKKTISEAELKRRLESILKDSDENYKGYQIGKTNYGWIIKKDGKKIVETETDSEARKYINKLVKDEEMIKTPRGRFRLSSKSYKELKEEGWGLHHSHKIEGKEYYIMAKDNKAIACLKDSARFSEIKDSYSEELKQRKIVQKSLESAIRRFDNKYPKYRFKSYDVKYVENKDTWVVLYLTQEDENDEGKSILLNILNNIVKNTKLELFYHIRDNSNSIVSKYNSFG
jgi:hypothetical protein